MQKYYVVNEQESWNIDFLNREGYETVMRIYDELRRKIANCESIHRICQPDLCCRA